MESSELEIRELKAVYKLSQVVAQSKPVANLAETMVELLFQNTASHRISIILKDPLTKEFRFLAGKNINKKVLSEGVVTIKDNVLSYVHDHREPILCNSMQKDKRFGQAKKLRYHSDKFICLPLLRKNGVVGFVSVTERKGRSTYSPADLLFVQNVGREFIEDYHLMRGKLELENKKFLDLEKEIKTQFKAFRFPSTLADNQNVEFQASSVSSQSLSHGYFDFIKLNHSRFITLISDSADKGIPSLVFGALCRSILHVSIEEQSDPHKVLKKVNQYIYNHCRSGMSATAFMVKVDMANKKFIYSSANHIEQLHYSHKTGKIQRFYIKSKPLGNVKEAKYQNKTIAFDKKDVFLLFTRGILNATNRRNQKYGIEKLEKLFKKNVHLSADKIHENVIRDVKNFTQPSGRLEELNLVAMKF